MKTTVRIIRAFIYTLILAAFLFEPLSNQKGMASQPEPPGSEGPEGALVSSTMAPAWSRAAHEWTAAEMAAAKPYPMPEPQGSPDMLLPAGSSPQAQTGAALQTFPAALPEGEVGFVNMLEVIGNFGATAPAGYGYPAPYTSYPIYAKYAKEFPYKTIGKLFFVQNGVAYLCTAAVIGTSAIWTAGHCVHDGRGTEFGWSYNTMFVPAYDSGKKPLWSWFAIELWTTDGWYDGNLAYDYGGVILDKTRRKNIAQKTGYLGFSFTPDASGYLPEHHWFQIGYPAGGSFSGAKQAVCASSYAYSDSSLSPSPVGVGCGQEGTSGGPWILAFGTGNYLNGNMSYRYRPEEIFSPYFGDAAYELWYELFY